MPGHGPLLGSLRGAAARAAAPGGLLCLLLVGLPGCEGGTEIGTRRSAALVAQVRMATPSCQDIWDDSLFGDAVSQDLRVQLSGLCLPSLAPGEPAFIPLHPELCSGASKLSFFGIFKKDATWESKVQGSVAIIPAGAVPDTVRLRFCRQDLGSASTLTDLKVKVDSRLSGAALVDPPWPLAEQASPARANFCPQGQSGECGGEIKVALRRHPRVVTLTIEGQGSVVLGARSFASSAGQPSTTHRLDALAGSAVRLQAQPAPGGSVRWSAQNPECQTGDACPIAVHGQDEAVTATFTAPAVGVDGGTDRPDVDPDGPTQRGCSAARGGAAPDAALLVLLALRALRRRARPAGRSARA